MFGKPPRGLWPSEGSIAPELIPIMQDCGIEYFCSDEENLFNSLKRDPTRAGAPAEHLELFQGWRVAHNGSAVNALFREKPLSDFIGFMASKNNAQAAAAHLLHHLRNIAAAVPADTGVIPLILDGENAWETFADGGEGFLRALYGGIEAEQERLHSCTIEEYFRQHAPTREITTLHTGSWIGSNFDIWIGEAEENRAWELLGETRDFLEEQMRSGALSAEQRCAALREIYAAEGSDWFWWYGPDFSTDNDALFDDLFRQHLRNVYRICGQMSPATLDLPIVAGPALPLFDPPRQPISPAINGRMAAFYEWSGSGLYVAGSEQGAMFRSDRLLNRIHFGSDDTHFYLRCDLHRWEQLALSVQFFEPAAVTVRTGIIERGGAGEFTVTDVAGKPVTRSTLAAEEIVELAIPLTDLAAVGAKFVSFKVRVLKDGIEREQYPERGPLECPLLGEEFALEHWVV